MKISINKASSKRFKLLALSMMIATLKLEDTMKELKRATAPKPNPLKK